MYIVAALLKRMKMETKNQQKEKEDNSRFNFKYTNESTKKKKKSDHCDHQSIYLYGHIRCMMICMTNVVVACAYLTCVIYLFGLI